jgi:hypothetical protein
VRRLRCQGPPMTIAHSTHRHVSLVPRRPAERAGAARDRSAHRRPGVGFLPPRLPVVRRDTPGYRIYTAADFVRSLDREHDEAGADQLTRDVRRDERQQRARRLPRRFALVAIIAGALAIASTTVLTVAWQTHARADGRARSWSPQPLTAWAGRIRSAGLLARAKRVPPVATQLARANARRSRLSDRASAAPVAGAAPRVPARRYAVMNRPAHAAVAARGGAEFGFE